MSTLPAGTVTFLLTDVEGSTAAWESDPDKMSRAVAELDELMATVVSRHQGVVVKPRGEGDSHFCVFTRVLPALQAGVALMAGLQSPEVGLRIRAAIHTGEIELRDGDYYGRTVNRAARLRASGHGGQLLISEAAAGLVRAELPAEISLRDLGSHRLKDLSSPETVFQVLHPDLEDVRTELSTLDQSRSNLPIQLTPLIGRDEDLATVSKLLGEYRLVTIVALGGSGKTRLALQVAAESSEAFPSGVRLANLLSISDPDQLGELVLSSLGAPAGDEDALAAAIDWVASRPILLVLDNCEHLGDAPAQWVARMLGDCPELRILATSRRPLEVAGERVFRLSSLGLPGPDELEPAELTQVPAVRLFVERAQSADPSFALDRDNAGAIAEICRRLDGLPLALELAAARVKVLDPKQILERLERQLEVPVARESGDANRTVLAAIAWSYAQLSPEAAFALRAMSIFEAPVDIDAVERVCSAPSSPDVADALAELVDNSLLVAESGPAGRRYRLLELVRSFAQRELDQSNEWEMVERARAEWVGWFIRPESPGGVADPQELIGLDGEFDAALRWAESNEPDEWVGFAFNVAGVRNFCYRPSAALTLARRALARVDRDDLENRVRGLRIITGAAFDGWEPQEGLAAGLELLEALETLDRDAAAEIEEAHNLIGVNAWRAGDLETARTHLQKYYELALARPDGWEDAALAANNLGLAAPDAAAASRWFHTQLEIERAHGRGGDALFRLGGIAVNEDRLDDAAELLTRAAQESPAWAAAQIQIQLAKIEKLRGNDTAAAAHLIEAEQLAETMSRSSVVSETRLSLAGLAHARGDYTGCDRLIDEAVNTIGPEPALATHTLMSAMDQWARAGHPDFSLRLAERFLAIAHRDGSAKHQAVAAYRLAFAQMECGLPEAMAAGKRAAQALADAGDGQVGKYPLSWYRDRLAKRMAEFEPASPTLDNQ